MLINKWGNKRKENQKSTMDRVSRHACVICHNEWCSGKPWWYFSANQLKRGHRHWCNCLAIVPCDCSRGHGWSIAMTHYRESQYQGYPLSIIPRTGSLNDPFILTLIRMCQHIDNEAHTQLRWNIHNWFLRFSLFVVVSIGMQVGKMTTQFKVLSYASCDTRLKKTIKR